MTLTVVSKPDFSGTTKTVLVTDRNADGETSPGDGVAYTVTVTNNGDFAATSVVVRDLVETTLTAVAAGQGGTYSGGTVTWSVASLAVGASATLTFSATIVTPLADMTVISNQAQVTSAEVTSPVASDDPGTPTLDDATKITVWLHPDAGTSTKTVADDNGDSMPGDVLTWTISVANTGTAPMQNASVTDVVDANLESV